MTNRTPMLKAAVMAALVGGWVCQLNTASAQTDYYFRHPDLQNPPAGAEPAPNGDWNLDTNGSGSDGGTYWWDPGLSFNYIPDHSFGDGERARVENGGLVYVQNDGGFYPGQIVLGSTAGTSGALEVRSGGVMHSRQGVMTNGNITVGSSTGVGSVTVLPGGLLTAETSIVSGNNAANSITVGGAGAGVATLTASSAQLAGQTRVYPNAAFSVTGGLNFSGQGNSVYTVEVTGNGVNGSASAGGTATLNGALNLNFDGYTPSVGHSWTVVEGAAVNGDFGSVTSNAAIPYNQSFVATKSSVGAGVIGYNVALEEVLVLEVNRDTGEAMITHPGSSTIQLDGYFVGSDAGALAFANRNSVSGIGSLGTGWVETAARPDNIGELKAVGEGTIAGGVSPISLGAIYDALAGDFGNVTEDLEFGYRRADGSKSSGVVRYTGTKANTLVLQVDPSGSGDAYLRNTSDQSVQFDAYEVLSASGSINLAGWNSLDNQNDAGNVWLEALDSTSNLIAEFDSQGFTTINPGQSWNLGPLFNGGAQDLSFNFLMQGDEEGTAGLVIYDQFVPGAGLAGDFNQDNVVNAADYTVWRDNVGAASLPNDNNLGVVGPAHYNLWRSQYGATLSAAASASAAPEPAACVLLVGALGAVGLRRRPVAA